MKRTSARSMLRGALLDAASIFGETDSAEQNAALDRHLDAAVLDYDRVLPRIGADQFTWQAGVMHYATPADANAFHTCALVEQQNELDPYDARRVDVVPTPTLAWVGELRMWRFAPAPNATLISKLGSLYPYTYYAAHRLTDGPGSTLLASRAPELVTRALVASLLELAIRNAHKPVALRDPTYSQTRNGTPAALADQLMRLWEQQVRPSSDLYGVMAGGR